MVGGRIGRGRYRADITRGRYARARPRPLAAVGGRLQVNPRARAAVNDKGPGILAESGPPRAIDAGERAGRVAR